MIYHDDILGDDNFIDWLLVDGQIHIVWERKKLLVLQCF